MKHGVFITVLNPDEVQEEVTTWFKGQTSMTRGYRNCFQDCLDNAGNYVEK